MKTNVLTPALALFALALCCLCAFQWTRETSTQAELAALRTQRFDLEERVQQHTNTIHQMDGRIAELTGTLNSLEATIHTNEIQLLELRTERSALVASNAAFSRQLESFAEAFSQATNRLNTAYDDIRKQNELISQVTAQRDDYVARLNDSIQRRNQIVTQYNDLVKKVEAYQNRQETSQVQP